MSLALVYWIPMLLSLINFLFFADYVFILSGYLIICHPRLSLFLHLPDHYIQIMLVFCQIKNFLIVDYSFIGVLSIDTILVEVILLLHTLKVKYL